MANDIYLVRSDTVAGLDDLLRQLGTDPRPLYRRVGLTPLLMANSDYMVPYDRVCELMDTAAKESGQEELGLILGGQWKRSQIGLLWPLMAHCSDVGEALKVGSEHLHFHSQGLSWQLVVEGSYAQIIREVREARVAGQVSSFQYAVHSTCAMFGVLKVLCGADWLPSEVSFIHTAPANAKAYNKFFGVKVEFNQALNQIVFPAAFLERKITDHNRGIYDQLTRQLQQLESQDERKQDFCSKMKLLIQKAIHTEDCSQTGIAGLLSMHPKALQRKLKNEGVTFRELKAEVRLDMAERYLKDSEIPLTTISEILKFSELSSFSHAFKSRHKVSPAVWRRRLRQGATDAHSATHSLP
ncbi:AraC family transcriptional regulator [Aestuariirhabdus litorea]|nr:AraC family transcriptional regulator [Aestuariirhabdus litorea]